MSRIVSTTITAPEAGKYLINFLSERFTYLSREVWKEEIIRGNILLNNTPAISHNELRRGDTVTYRPEQFEEPPVPLGYRIIHREKDFIVINKPPGLPCHPGGRYRSNTLWNLLLPEFPELHFMNRLDRETSGIIVAALTKRGQQVFRKTEQLTKDYLVVVHGSFPEVLDASGWISQDRNSKIRKKQRFSSSYPDNIPAKDSRTILTALTRNKTFTLLKACIKTGRTHQIRATLSCLGYPVAGDKLYGLDEGLFLRLANGSFSQDDAQSLPIGHQAIHSAHLSFPGPDNSSSTGTHARHIYAELPEAFAAFVGENFSIDLSTGADIAELFRQQCQPLPPRPPAEGLNR